MISQDERALRKICSGEIDQKYEKWLSQCLLEDIKHCGSPKKREMPCTIIYNQKRKSNMIDSLRWTRLLPYLPNPTLAPLQMGRRQSQLQRVQHLSNLQKINASNTENRDPRTSPTALLKTELKKQCARADDNARKLHNKAREAQRAKTARDVLRLEKRQLTHMSRMRASRVPNQKQLAVARALKQAAARPGDLYMKDKGVIKEDCREMLRELQVLNVPVEKINAVIHVVAKGFGLNVKDQVSARAVGRIMREGGVAAQIQLVHEAEHAKGEQFPFFPCQYNIITIIT
jgi:hypothetical protein